MSTTKLNERQLKTLGGGNIASDDEVATAVSNHVANLDPHLQYLTDAKGDTKYSTILHNHDNNYVIKNTPITSNTFTKITYDTKGLINGGSNLLVSDIPNLDWNKITSGKPTTLAGYGITDGTSSLISNSFFNISTGVPWSSITGTPKILPSLMSAIQVAPVSGTTVIPFDNTEPLITEGTEIARVAYIPSDPLSKMIVQGALFVNCNNTNKDIVIALFKGSICIGATAINFAISGRPQILNFIFSDLVLGNNFGLSSVIYTVRIGIATSGTWYVNKDIVGVFNGLLGSSSITFSEYM